MPTARRAVFIMVNMADMPLLGLPTSQAWAPSKLMTQVDEALIPIFFSIEPQATLLRAPGLPCASGRNFGQTKSEMPRMPAGASGRRASTRWMMFAVRSCSPAEMKILVPKRL